MSVSRQLLTQRELDDGLVLAAREPYLEPLEAQGQGHLRRAATVTGDILYVDGGSHFGRW